MENLNLEKEDFNFEKSPLKEAYILLGAHSPLELSKRYDSEDQHLMGTKSWDYNNDQLIVNKVKDIIEKTDFETLTEVEKDWGKEILYFWYHHAISCAIWRYKDKEKAQLYTKKALTYQSENHPNKITFLFHLLINDKTAEAEKWVESIQEEPEKSTAKELLIGYKEKGFFN